MYDFETKNAYFDRLSTNPKLRWLGQNTNHLPLPPEVKAAMVDAIDTDAIRGYAPPLGIEALRRGILDDLGLDGMSVMVTDGAIEGLYHACRTLVRAGDDFVTTDPGWQWPIRFAQASGARVVEIPIYDPAQSYKLRPEQLAAAMTERTRLVYLVDPNNPLGIAYTADEIQAFARICRDAGAYLIHDCTYRHFAHDHTLAARFYPERTLTTYSFSKWLGLAGLRVGAVVADGAVIEQLASAPPNNLGSNVLSQRAALAGLGVKARWFPEVQRVQRENQAAIARAVAGVEGLAMPVYPSNGNFVIVEVVEAGITPEALVAAYQQRDIMIRQGAYHSRTVGDRFVKISTTVPSEWVGELCELLPEMVDVARGLNDVGPQY
ncbi:MAG: pyridoxal phosphate-dependent aminotransferase [Ectothiorhodospiraceae bacterium]|nr:pyridoxal phosphate-dependent aminotransferase [Ectothiorhodospiraceae bacterium]